MGFDEELAGRVRAALSFETGITEKRMFGGLAFLVGGHLAVAASRSGGLMVRIDPAQRRELLDAPAVLPMRMNGRELDGWLIVAPEALDDDPSVLGWVQRGLAFARTLPPK